MNPSLVSLIEFPTEFGSNLAAVIPFALPLVFGAILLLLYQRYLPSKELRRNLIIFIALLGAAGAFIMILYAGFGSMYWMPTDVSFGSYDVFVAILQRVTHMVFTYNIAYFMIYLIGTIVIFTFMANYVISPPDPDFVLLRDKLKELSDISEGLAKTKKELEAENKKLNEFLKEKEENLDALQAELVALKEAVGERETAITEMEAKLKSDSEDATREQELLETISKKDETIGRLQSEIDEIRLMMESSKVTAEASTTPAVDSERVKELNDKINALTAQLEDYTRRAETASEVSDSVISDLAQLISQIESSGLEPSTKEALSSLIEGLGRSMGRIAGSPAEKDDTPKVELIGAVMMAHEIVDSIKKMARQ